MKDTPRHAGRLFLWQRRRRSTEDAPREENEDLTGEESQPGHELKLNQREKGKTPQVTLADLAQWQRRRSSKEDVPREENEDLTGEESHRRRISAWARAQA